MVFQPLGIFFSRFRVEPDRNQESHHKVMPRLGGGRHGLASLSQEEPAIGLRFHQTITLQTADRRGDGRLGDAHAACEVDSTGFVLLPEKVGDQFHVILRSRTSVRLALAGEAGMVVGRRKRPLRSRFTHKKSVIRLEPLDSLYGIPAASIVTNQTQLYIAMGILGATVMPHNLYLHTAVVQSRAWKTNEAGKREAIKFATIDSSIALTLALFINSALLITAAATFNTTGNTEVAEIGDAYHLIAPLLGSGLAAPLFALALLFCGLNATVTATLAGQVVMEGFLRFRLHPVLRRLVTRLVAIVPAILVTWFYGTSGTAQLLILSQVILSIQLPFAVIPLMLFAQDKRRLGVFVAPSWQLVLGWATAAVILGLNMKLLFDAAFGE